MVGASARLGNARQLTEEIALKFSPLVTVYTGWKSKPWYKIIVNLFSHRSCCLVSGWVCLCKPCEVTYYQQNVLRSALAFLQMEKVYGHHLKRGSCRDALHWCFGRDLRLLLLDAATFVGNEVLDILLHLRPIEPGPSQVHHSICAKVTHFNVGLLENKLLKFCG